MKEDAIKLNGGQSRPELGDVAALRSIAAYVSQTDDQRQFGAVLSEAALRANWLNDEEDANWAHLQRGR